MIINLQANIPHAVLWVLFNNLLLQEKHPCVISTPPQWKELPFKLFHKRNNKFSTSLKYCLKMDFYTHTHIYMFVYLFPFVSYLPQTSSYINHCTANIFRIHLCITCFPSLPLFRIFCPWLFYVFLDFYIIQLYIHNVLFLAKNPCLFPSPSSQLQGVANEQAK